jgi:hypothetical protein
MPGEETMTFLDRRRSVVLRVILAASAVVPLGCGGSADARLVPVSGQVFVQGRPAAGATVIFHPMEALVAAPTNRGDSNTPLRQFPTATVADDGSFQLTTLKARDGAPPGQYRVSIFWSESYRDDEGDWVTGPDKLGGRYAYPMTSGLSATIEQGENQLPRFELY